MSEYDGHVIGLVPASRRQLLIAVEEGGAADSREFEVSHWSQSPPDWAQLVLQTISVATLVTSSYLAWMTP